MKNITYKIGDATIPDMTLPGIHIIAHCCNDIGQFGAGFVVPLAKQYPGVKEAYKIYIKQTPNPLGTVFIYHTRIHNLYIANIIGQHDIFPINGIAPIRYESLKKGFMETVKMFNTSNINFHLPRIGCGLAGGDWNRVETLLKEIGSNENVDSITVYDLK